MARKTKYRVDVHIDVFTAHVYYEIMASSKHEAMNIPINVHYAIMDACNVSINDTGYELYLEAYTKKDREFEENFPSEDEIIKERQHHENNHT